MKELKFKQKFLLEYVEKGGNMIVQYNTNRGVDVAAPFSFKTYLEIELQMNLQKLNFSKRASAFKFSE